MDDFTGSTDSWNGFIDYIRCYHIVEPLWIAVGACIFVGTAGSLIPQIIRIIRKKTSYGISPFFVLVTSVSQFLVVLNVFCLHNADFYGMVQIPLSRTIPRQLTFGNLFILWIAYLPIGINVLIFFDRQEKPNRSKEAIKREWNITLITTIILVIIILVTFIVFVFLGFAYGLGSNQVLKYGKGVGTVSTFITLCQYLPQFITTCKIKDNGSLSLITLGIQAPGGTINAIFMMLGNNDDWTTYLSTLSSAIQQWLLLGLCIYYKLKQRRRNRMKEPLLGYDKTASSVSTMNEGSDSSKIAPYQQLA